MVRPVGIDPLRTSGITSVNGNINVGPHRDLDKDKLFLEERSFIIEREDEDVRAVLARIKPKTTLGIFYREPELFSVTESLIVSDVYADLKGSD